MFSPNEKEILKILGRRKMTIEQIAADFYFGPHTVENQNYIGGAIRRIARKCASKKLTWTIVGKGIGRGGRTVWRSRRK